MQNSTGVIQRILIECSVDGTLAAGRIFLALNFVVPTPISVRVAIVSTLKHPSRRSIFFRLHVFPQPSALLLALRRGYRSDFG